MKQIVVISGKGGTGKTSIVGGLAATGMSMVLADCDVDAPDLHLLLKPRIKSTVDFMSGELPTIDRESCLECGLCRSHCRFSAITEEFEILPEHCEGCGVCEFVCPANAVTMLPRKCGVQHESLTRFGSMVHAALDIGQENSGKLVTSVRSAAKQLAESEGAEILLVDGSPGVGCPVIASLTDTDACVLVSEPTISAVHDMKRVLKLLKHFRIPGLILMNKVGINADIEAEIRTLCETENLPIIGELPYDTRFTKAQIEELTAPEYDSELFEHKFRDIWVKILYAIQ